MPPTQAVVHSYALFPHQRVEGNVAFGLKARRMRRAEVARRVGEGPGAYARRFPRELSGGQQQRGALAIRRRVLLLDEPLSALDATLREDMVAELLRLRAELPDTTLIYVTHDRAGALALADRVAVLREPGWWSRARANSSTGGWPASSPSGSSAPRT
nr:ATP-binding cassette domain-containing protein [Amycolatopsis sulphurea]